MLYISVIIIAIVSVALAFRSLKRVKKMEEVDEVKKELSKGKVVYHRDSSSSVSSDSSE